LLTGPVTYISRW